MTKNKNDFHVWLGSETGLLKGVDLVKKLATNHFDQSRYGKAEEVLAMSWEDGNYQKLVTGHKSGMVSEYNPTSGDFQDPVKVPDIDPAKEQIVSLYKYDDVVTSCTTEGNWRMWEVINGDNEHRVKNSTNVGANILDMKVNHDRTKFATGGKENPLKIWDIKKLDDPVFKAKNVPHDWLQLRVPVWLTGLEFLKQSEKIVTCTGTSKVRLYDPLTPQRRPCVEMTFDEYPLKAMTLTHNVNQVIVANTRGTMAMFDLRKKSLVHAYKGFAGSIRSLACHPSLNYVASCGLDRFLRIHDIESGILEHKVYLKSRLNRVLFTDVDFVLEAQKIEELEQEEQRKRELEENSSEDEDGGELWNEMRSVDDNDEDLNIGKTENVRTPKKRKRKR